MTGMEAHLRAEARETFRRVRQKAARRELRQAHEAPTCDFKVWNDGTRMQQRCAMPATHRGTGMNQLHYCGHHAAWLESRGTKLHQLSPTAGAPSET